MVWRQDCSVQDGQQTRRRVLVQVHAVSCLLLRGDQAVRSSNNVCPDKLLDSLIGEPAQQSIRRGSCGPRRRHSASGGWSELEGPLISSLCKSVSLCLRNWDWLSICKQPVERKAVSGPTGAETSSGVKVKRPIVVDTDTRYGHPFPIHFSVLSHSLLPVYNASAYTPALL